jgi:RNA polymerase sigma-70 factor (ECF subfamily)
MGLVQKRECLVSVHQWLFTMRETEGQPVAEAALLRAGQAGDRTALDQLLALHQRSLRALCHGILGHAEDAEDAVQETFLRALRALPGFRGEASFRTWLSRIAVNVCLNWKEAQRRDPALLGTEPWDELLPGATSHAESPEVIALRRLRILEALRELPRRHRAIFLLKVLEGWSVAEIGQAMGWNSMRVQNELFKARRALAEWRRRDADEGEER